jgi:hypothetical protein
MGRGGDPARFRPLTIHLRSLPAFPSAGTPSLKCSFVNFVTSAMAPVISSSSTILAILLETKQFLTAHYLLVILSGILLRLVYLRYLTPYRDIPGPFLATISPLWKLRAALNGTLHTDLTAMHKKYGPIFRIAPDEVSISDPEAIKVIYSHGAGFTKVPRT